MTIPSPPNTHWRIRSRFELNNNHSKCSGQYILITKSHKSDNVSLKPVSVQGLYSNIA